MDGTSAPFPLPAMDLGAVTGWLVQYLFAMLRIGGFLLASPGYGGRFTPLPVRIMATVVLAVPVMAGGVVLPAPGDLAGLGALRWMMPELALGLTGGLVLSILFGAATLAGDRIAAMAGLGFAAQYDPAAGGQTPVVSQFFGLFLMLVFLATDAHLAAIRIVLDSYIDLPPGAPFAVTRLIAAGLSAGTAMFLLGFGVMMPVVAMLLLLNVAVGVITRSAPQVNIFSFGFPVTMTATMILLYLTAPMTGAALDDVVRAALGLLRDMIGAGNGRG
jgi:flagellar biosynthesis protein FliR